MIDHLKSLCSLILMLLCAAFLAIAMYGQIAGNGTDAWYSEELDATCITERHGAALAMSCMPGNRLSKEKDQ